MSGQHKSVILGSMFTFEKQSIREGAKNMNPSHSAMNTTEHWIIHSCDTKPLVLPYFFHSIVDGATSIAKKKLAILSVWLGPHGEEAFDLDGQ